MRAVHCVFWRFRRFRRREWAGAAGRNGIWRSGDWNQKDYAGRKFTARYQTNGYYEICASEQGFRLDYRLFPAPVVRSFDDVFFGEWLEAPAAFGAFDGEGLVEFAEGSIESWNNRFRSQHLHL